MSTTADSDSQFAPGDREEGADLTGVNDCLDEMRPTTAEAAPVAKTTQRGMARNVLSNWFGHFFFIAVGFIMPRLINDHLGQTRLGLWDYGWSFVSYLGLLTTGITASTNRYVAHHGATSDWATMNRSISACFSIFLCTGILTVLVTIAAVSRLEQLVGPSVQPFIAEARVLILLLGIATAVQMPTSVWGGVITGCNRYDLATSIEVTTHVVSAIGIGVALMAGCGLVSLGWIVLMSYGVLGGILRYAGARRVCPMNRVSPHHADWNSVKGVTIFGWKLFLENGSRIILYQSTSMLVARFLGLPALASYARASSLVMHANKVMYQFGRVYTPVVSAMQARGDKDTVRELVTSSMRYSIALSLPMVLALSILGAPLLRVWMGPGYDESLLLAVLIIGHFAAMVHVGTYHILLGLNTHGAAGVATFVLSVGSVACSAVLLGVFKFGVVAAALSIGISLTLLNAIIITRLAATAAQMRVRDLLAGAIPGPFVAAVPFALTLAAIRVFCSGHPRLELALAIFVGGPAIAIMYYFRVLSHAQRDRVFGRLRAMTGVRQPVAPSSKA